MAGQTHNADVIVIGLGAYGSAALVSLAKRGVAAVGIDRFEPPHGFGSSHGETRITRQAVGEGPAYVPLVLRSHEIWRELETRSGMELFKQCGMLLSAPAGGLSRVHGQDSFFGTTLAVARAHGIVHEELGADEIMRRFPQFILNGDEVGYYEPGAGYVHPERCIAAQLTLARELGAKLRTGETVIGIDETSDAITVRTDRDTYHASRVVLSAGAWLPALAGDVFARHLKVHRQTLHWFEAKDVALYDPVRCPVFITIWGPDAEDNFYGFPTPPGSVGVKVATERYRTVFDPDDLDRSVTFKDDAEMFETHVRGRLADLTGRCLESKACCYTVTPDAQFLIDTHPETARMLVVSACSGHGFKHSAALGEVIAETVISASPSRFPLAPFGLARLAARPAPSL